MLNNDDGANPQVPEEVRNAMEKYKNQITDLEFEAKRLQKHLAEKKIELSNTSDEITSNKNIIDSLDNSKQSKSDELDNLKKDIKEKETKSKELEAENKKSEEAITKRETAMILKEKDLNTKVVSYEEKNISLLESIKNNSKDTAEIERKKQILLEAISKL